MMGLLVSFESYAEGIPPVPSGDLVKSFKPSKQAADQLEGKYTDLGRENLPLGMIQEAWSKGGDTAGIYTVQHQENRVIRVALRENTKSLIQLPSFEKIKTILVGNEAILEAEGLHRNFLILSPKRFVGVDTNVTILGESGLIYNFYVAVHGYNSKRIPDLKVVVWSQYLPELTQEDTPPEEAEKTVELAPHKVTGDFLQKVTFDADQLTYNFSMAGDKEIAPDRVFTDGWRTFFDYGDRMGREETPVIYKVVDGVDTEVTVIRKGNLLVATDTGDFALLLGKKRVCVWPSGT